MIVGDCTITGGTISKVGSYDVHATITVVNNGTVIAAYSYISESTIFNSGCTSCVCLYQHSASNVLESNINKTHTIFVG